jgi:hypothetical protein
MVGGEGAVIIIILNMFKVLDREARDRTVARALTI